jgi:anti-sigma-K factor RskA
LVAPEAFVSRALRPSRRRWRWIVGGVAAAAAAITIAGLFAPQPAAEPPVDVFVARHVSVNDGASAGGDVLFAVNGR